MAKLEKTALTTFQPGSTKTLPDAVDQNPAVVQEDQAYLRAVSQQRDRIMAFFLNALPSNYVSQVVSPFYTLQFQAAAEQLAKLQVSASEVFADQDLDYTRPEYLHQILGALLFPDTQNLPEIESDLAQRRFFKDMVRILGMGSTRQALQEALALLTDASVQIIECAIEARGTTNSGYSNQDQFVFEIFLSNIVTTTTVSDHYHLIQIETNGTGRTVKTIWTGTAGAEHQHEIVGFLPQTTNLHTHELVSSFADPDPAKLFKNVAIVLQAIKPAHTLYRYHNLFRETFRELAVDTETSTYTKYDYEDLRSYWNGLKELSSSTGEILTDRTLLRDTARTFEHVLPDADLWIESGVNSGKYRVKEVLVYPVGSDEVVLASTLPTGKSTYVQCSEDIVTAVVYDYGLNRWVPDTTFDWVGIVENEVLNLPTGPLAGNYRFKSLVGNDGGPILTATGPAHQARLAPCLIRLDRRAKQSMGVSYKVSLDRLGKQTGQQVSLEDVSAQFVDRPLERNFFTLKGPLVKNGGDASPATINDVSVTVNGVAALLSEVNPYTGEVTLQAAPPIGAIVRVSYYWIAVPTVEMAGLNDPGLLLNQWDAPNGLVCPPAHGSQPLDPDFPLGSMLSGRFQMRSVLGPLSTLEPIHYGYRYLGLERDYSAVLNDPLSLLLNQNPNATAVDLLVSEPEAASTFYDATTYPTLAGWTLQGSDSGTLNTDGTYTTKVQTPGNYQSGQQALYYQSVDLEYPSSVRVETRLKVDSGSSLWSGVGFGAHDNKRTYQVGFLNLTPVSTEAAFKTIGFLLNPEEPQVEASWLLGPTVSMTVLDPITIKATTATLPQGIASGTRFKIRTGPQAGVYVCTVVTKQPDGTTTVVVAQPFPRPNTEYQAKYVAALFEIDHAVLSTYLLTANPSTQQATLFVAGSLTGEMIRLTSAQAEPSSGALELQTHQKGQIWWGCLSRQTACQATWSFFQYSISPDLTRKTSKGKTVSVSGIPDQNTNPEQQWSLQSSFGHAGTIGGGTQIVSGLASEQIPYGYGYSRVEPFLQDKTVVDVEAIFKVLRQSGRGEATIQIEDQQRHIEMSTLTYEEPNGNLPRRLVWMPGVSVGGLTLPTEQGCTQYGTIHASIAERTLHTTPGLSGGQSYYENRIQPYEKQLTGTLSTWLPETRQIITLDPTLQAGDTVTITVASGPYTFTAVNGAPAAHQFSIVSQNIFATAHNLHWAIAAEIPDIQVAQDRNLVICYANTQGVDGYGFSVQCTSVSGLQPTTLSYFQEYQGSFGASKQLKGSGTRFLTELNINDIIWVNQTLVRVTDILNDETLLISAITPAFLSQTGWVRPYTELRSRTTETRMRITQYTGNDAGVFVQGSANGRSYTLGFYEVVGVRQLGLVNHVGGIVTVLGSWAFDWLGQYHTYRMVADALANTVVLLADEVVVGSVALNLFTNTGFEDRVRFGFNEFAAANLTVDWSWVNHTVRALPLTTLGIWKGGDRTQINNWEIPRTDALPVSNQDSAAVVFSMDTSVAMQVHLRRDPVWGVTLYRPDLPPPPYWGGDGFTTEITDPTQGWINLTMQELPEAEAFFGNVAFGALRPDSINVQHWGRFQYRLSTNPAADTLSPQHMVLNQAHQIVSGELSNQTQLEVLVVEALDDQHVSMHVTGISASRIYSVVDGNTLLSQTTWGFDPAQQLLSLGYDASGYPVRFSSAHAPITITFTPGQPVSETYLRDLPFWQTVTKLNESTPPFQPERALEIQRSVVADLGASTYHLEFTPETGVVDNSTYNSCTLITVQDAVDNQTGLIAIAQDNLPSTGQTGWISGEGEHLYDSAGADLGPIGQPAATEAFWVKGAGYQEQTAENQDPAWNSIGWAVGPSFQDPKAFYVSGGSYYTEYLDETDPLNPIVVTVPLGGLVGPTVQPVPVIHALQIQDNLVEILLT